MSDTENNNDEENTTPIEEPVVVTKKDPKKVEQGKKLAMISKEAKERKMRARLEREQKENESWWKHTPLVVAVGSSFGFVITTMTRIISFYNPDGDDRKIMFNKYLCDVSSEELRRAISFLRRKDYSYIDINILKGVYTLH